MFAERYATVLDGPQQDRRRQAGLPPEPVVATISRRADPALAAVPLFAETGLRIQVYTEASDPPAFERGADVAVSVVEPGTLSPSACLDHLQRERGADVVLCEGGPTLLHALLADGLVDDLVLTLAPMVVAGDGRSILHGPVFDPPARLALKAVLRGEDHLFLHYAVAA